MYGEKTRKALVFGKQMPGCGCITRKGSSHTTTRSFRELSFVSSHLDSTRRFVMKERALKVCALLLFAAACVLLAHTPRVGASNIDQDLDQRLEATLSSHGFTGRIESTLELRLG